MCGIAGLLVPPGRQSLEEHLRAQIRHMSTTLAHRGPDDSGEWVDGEAQIALGHRRLSILDLSPLGHQPMTSESGRFVIVYNGEVYNYRDLRRDLEKCGHAFRSQSDTEVLLSGIEEWGVEETLKRSNGMFALGLWDRAERTLSLARDRLGQKPLYFGTTHAGFVFASELKAIRSTPGFEAKIDQSALTEFFRHNYVPAPMSIYRGISKILPGTWLTVSAQDPKKQEGGWSLDGPKAYWSAESAAQNGLNDVFDGDEAEALDRLDTLLRDAVKMRLISDVPLGAFLSGGIDSTVITALMQAQSQRPVKTFSIGFTEESYNEAPHAKAVAEHLGTEHAELYVTPNEARNVIPELPRIYDEPFSDSSQIPTCLVSRFARQHVTVALSGDGGDEMFGGYARYQLARNLWQRIDRAPVAVRRVAVTGTQLIPDSLWDVSFGWLTRSGTVGRAGRPRDKVRALREVLDASSADALYARMISHWYKPERLLAAGVVPASLKSEVDGVAPVGDFPHRMMLRDTEGYLPDDILVKVDRASMAVGLEARSPLLDHRVMEYAWQLPLTLRTGSGNEKRLLRELAYRYVPKDLLERPKMGFGVPVGDWIKGPLREWSESLLSENRLRREGLLDAKTVRRVWNEHLTGQGAWPYHLWDILMFQAWLAENPSTL